jgi:hypothetical protein
MTQEQPLITINRGGQDIPENFEPGPYIVVLTQLNGPKTVTAQKGPKAGQDIDLFDWIFNIFDGPHEGLEVQASSSTASGPKSKLYSYITALSGGRAPAVGTAFNRDDLVGKLALATISINDGGWLVIDNLSAVPASILAGKVAAATGAPVTAEGAPAPVAAAAAPVAANPATDLPF